MESSHSLRRYIKHCQLQTPFQTTRCLPQLDTKAPVSRFERALPCKHVNAPSAMPRFQSLAPELRTEVYELHVLDIERAEIIDGRLRSNSPMHDLSAEIDCEFTQVLGKQVPVIVGTVQDFDFRSFIKMWSKAMPHPDSAIRCRALVVEISISKDWTSNSNFNSLKTWSRWVAAVRDNLAMVVQYEVGRIELPYDTNSLLMHIVENQATNIEVQRFVSKFAQWFEGQYEKDQLSREDDLSRELVHTLRPDTDYDELAL